MRRGTGPDHRISETEALRDIGEGFIAASYKQGAAARGPCRAALRMHGRLVLDHRRHAENGVVNWSLFHRTSGLNRAAW